MIQLIFIVFLMLFFNSVYGTHPNEHFSTEDKECLALNIYFEARNQSIEGKIGVGLVTLNRVYDKRWPDTICGVVWQRYQFSWTHDGKSDNPYEKEAYEMSLIVAEYILSNNLKDIDITQGSTHYHATWLEKYPTWSGKLLQTIAIDEHVFYK